MKKTNYFPIILVIIFIGIVVFIFVFLNKNSELYVQNDQSPLSNTSYDESTNAEEINIISDEEIQNEIIKKSEQSKTPIETELSNFTTNLSFSSEGRLKNIEITSKKLNGTIVNSGEEFSFNDTARSIYS